MGASQVLYNSTWAEGINFDTVEVSATAKRENFYIVDFSHTKIIFQPMI